MPNIIDQKIQELNIQLPEPLAPVGAYQPILTVGEFGFLSGQISKEASGKLWSGKVGSELSLEDGQKAARAAALNAISVIKHHLGFEKFSRIVRVVGYVQCEPSYSDIHKVMNGASDVLKEVFGEPGIHARSAIGVASLPLNSAVEVEVTVGMISTS